MFSSCLILAFLLSHRLFEFCYFFTVCVSMVIDLVIKAVRGMHSQSITQTGYYRSESDEVCVDIIFSKSCDFISNKNGLISDCFCVLLIQYDYLCRCHITFYYYINSFVKKKVQKLKYICSFHPI